MAKQEESKPDSNSVEWNDYVMTLFHPSEMIDGKPLTAGLRRVAELLLGEIISSKPIQVNSRPDKDSRIEHVTVVYEVQFLVRVPNANGTCREYVKTYADCADVWEGNTDDLYAVHGSATASTRAEGRALRKALKIKTIAAEESCKKDVSKFLGSTVQADGSERIDKNQVTFIGIKCKKLDIDVVKFYNSGKKFYNSIHEIKKDVAAEMVKHLNELSADKTKIQDCIKGYKEDWNIQ